ncbi:hypothetical protein FRB99_008693 [Tulasnella sp. 403]|nr:hypothetical protein FRB99_008693 [Tulasnella sp. 403]
MLVVLNLLIISTLVSATPLQRRSAAVIPLPARATHSKGGVFNADALKRERLRLATKYGKHLHRSNVNTTHPTRSVSNAAPFDIQRRANSGKDPLIDDYDGVDEGYYGPLQSEHRSSPPAEASLTTIPTIPSWYTASVYYCPVRHGLERPLGPSLNLPRMLRTSLQELVVQHLQAMRQYLSPRSSEIPFSLKYDGGDGASGKVATDTVTVAGLTVAEQGFGAVTNETDYIGPMAGLLGLGFPANAVTGATPFFIGLVKAGSLASNVFSFYMSRSDGSGSELCIGCINSAKYTGSIQYYGIDPSATNGTQRWWNIPSGGFSYNGGPSSGSFTAVIDSGTTAIPGAASAPHIGGGHYTYPCHAKLAPITIKFGNTDYAIDPADFNFGPTSHGSSKCIGGIIARNDDKATIGDVFMKNWYSVFDYDRMAVGFAKAI